MQISQNTSQHVLYYQERYYPLNKAKIVIGSDPRCDICIEGNPRISPAHACVVSQQGQVYLQSLDRNAALWINGVLVAESAALQDRAEIAIGDSTTRLLLLLNRTYANPAEDTPYVLHRDPMAGAAQPVQNTSTAVPPYATPAAAFSTDTTRYLCAAGHLEEDFQDYVIRHVIHEDRRAMGETYGVDMPAVVSWCKAGRLRINIRDSVLCVFFLLICLLFLIHMFQLIGNFFQQYNQYNQYY